MDNLHLANLNTLNNLKHTKPKSKRIECDREGEWGPASDTARLGKRLNLNWA